MHAVRFNPRIIVILAPPDCISAQPHTRVYSASPVLGQHKVVGMHDDALNAC